MSTASRARPSTQPTRIQRVLGTLTVLFIAGLSLHGAEGAVPCAPRPELEARLKRAPRDDVAMECLARALIIEGKPSDAVARMEKAVNTNAQSAEHHLWLANALREEVQNVSALRRPAAEWKRRGSRRRRSPRSIWFVAKPTWRRSRSAKRTMRVPSQSTKA